jgi:two-component system NtrC family sensor kinase
MSGSQGPGSSTPSSPKPASSSPPSAPSASLADRLVRARARIAELERRVTALNRVAVMGTVATGLAHEINNALAYVVPNIDFADEQLSSFDHGSSEQLSMIAAAVREANEGARHLKGIADSMQSFGRVEGERRKPQELRRVVENAVAMTASEFRQHARLVVELGETPVVLIDEVRLVQVLVNLLINAAQAIPEGSAHANEVVVRTGVDATGRPFIEVRDTGEGIPDDIRAKIFEPFFTTKALGKGTGLGLATVFGIVQECRGAVEVESSEKVGTTLTVLLPCLRRATPRPRPSMAPLAAG